LENEQEIETAVKKFAYNPESGLVGLTAIVSFFYNTGTEVVSKMIKEASVRNFYIIEQNNAIVFDRNPWND